MPARPARPPTHSCSAISRRHVVPICREQPLVQCLWRPVRAVGPRDRFTVQSYLSDQLRIAQRLKDLTGEAVYEINLTLQAVAESQPEHVIADVADARDANEIKVVHGAI